MSLRVSLRLRAEADLADAFAWHEERRWYEWSGAVDIPRRSGPRPPGRQRVRAPLQRSLGRVQHKPAEAPRIDPRRVSGGTCVTRRGIHVDRIACAWLVRRFLDPDAGFKRGAALFEDLHAALRRRPR